MSNFKDEIGSSSNDDDDSYQAQQRRQQHQHHHQQQYQRTEDINNDDDVDSYYSSINQLNRRSTTGNNNNNNNTTAGIRQLTLQDNNRKQIIMATATDAIKAKYATVHAGYYTDPYVSLFYHPPSTPSSIRSLSQVIIKRGTLGRVKCMERAIQVYLTQVQQQYYNNNDDSKQTKVSNVLVSNDDNDSQQQQQQSSKSQKKKNSVQIVVLGAGYDTTYLRFFGSKEKQSQQKESWNNNLDDIKWYEIDHNEIITEKIRILRQQKMKTKTTKSTTTTTTTNTTSSFNITESLFSSKKSSVELQQQHSSVYKLTINESDENNNLLASIDASVTSSSSSCCYYVGYDFNNDPEILLRILQEECNIDSTIPTLLVMECVQMYLSVGTNRALLSTFQQQFPQTCTICSYEPILGPTNSPSNNTFGKMMEQNFIKAGFVQHKQQQSLNNHDDSITNDTSSSMVLQYRTIQEYLQYYNNIGYNTGIGCDMYTAYTTILSKSIQQHANQCEFLDELEEFILIMKHYCFIVVTNDPTVGKLYCSPISDNISMFQTMSTDNYDQIGFRKGSCEVMK